MTTKRIVMSLLCVGSLAAACGTAAEAPGDAAPERAGRASGVELRAAGEEVDYALAAGDRGERAIAFERASFLRPHIASLDLAPDARLVIEGADGERLTYRARDNGPDLWAPALLGGRLTVRLERDGEGPAGSYAIDRVGVGFPDGDELGPLATQCGTSDLVHVACFNTSTYPIYDPPAFNAAKAVAQIIVSTPSGSLGYCTGWLISGDNHFLTNHHCVPDQAAADTLTVIFNYQVVACGSQTNAAKESISGATFLQGSAQLDYALLKLPTNQVPPQALAGSAPLNPAAKYGFIPLDSSGDLRAGQTEIYIPQHPGGAAARKQIAFSDSEAAGANCRVRTVNASLSGNKPGASISYQCDTKDGSSGSPVLSTVTNKAVALHNRGGVGCPAADNAGIGIRDIYPEIKCYVEGTLPCGAPADSCVGRCGQQAPAGCRCDADCVADGSCCGDKLSVCGSEVPSNSCINRCGQQAPSGCFCDAGCSGGQFNDCCTDKVSVCDSPAEPNSCKGRCEGSQQAPSGCWCDPGCHNFNDCCGDRALYCQAP